MFRSRTLGPAALVILLCLGCAARRPMATYPPGATAGGPPTRGGHAVFVREGDPDYMDPALTYENFSSPVTNAVYRTLLDYADAPGRAGTALLPELAESLPDLREGGTLYAFKVRADARFGPPLHRHITAADFKYSIERLFRKNSPGVPFYSAIVGADDVIAGRDSTLSGVIARGDSLYIRIRKPDPVFLEILSMPFTAPVAREVAEVHRDDFAQHIVATGPYMVTEFTPRRRVMLARNPDYCGTPGYLDTIEVRFGVSVTNAVAMIKRGLADGGFFDVPAAEFGRLRADPLWHQQLDVGDAINTEYIFMNTHVHPFDDVRVRQAVCWTLDRRAFVKVYAGLAVPAYEVLPPTMPGSRSLNLYHGPDRAKARALLAEAGYPHGFETKFYSTTTDPIPRVVAITQQQLAEIGIRTRLDFSEAGSYWGMIGDTTNQLPIGYAGWFADYVDPSNFLQVLLDGRRITAEHNNNSSMFDDSTVNAMMDEALATRDDSLRFARWGAVDRAVMERAPIAPAYHQLTSRLYSLRIGGWYLHVTRGLKLDKLYIKRPVEPVAARPGAGS